VSALPSRAQVVRRRALAFPRDHGAHPETRIEWWYVTGELQAQPAGVGVYGFQITFFRSRTTVAREHASAFAARQIIFAHAALTDVAQRRLRHDQRAAREGFGIASAALADASITLRDWSLIRAGGLERGVYRARAASTIGAFGFDLRLAATQPLLLQGDAGFSRKGPQPTQASYYVSEPQLDVQGDLVLDGNTQRVRGHAWLDHEWSDELLDPQAVGWDWIGMNLDSGAALTAFRLRRADGSALWAGGSLRELGGATRNFGVDEVQFVAGRRWRSAITGASYPVEWVVQTPAGRHAVRARVDAQELDSRSSTGTAYWEGLSELLDADGRHVGGGYLEMTGYAGRLRLD